MASDRRLRQSSKTGDRGWKHPAGDETARAIAGESRFFFLLHRQLIHIQGTIFGYQKGTPAERAVFPRTMFIYNFIRAWNSAELRQAPDFVDQQLDEMQAFNEQQRKMAAATPPPPAPPTAVTKPAPIPPRPPVTKKEGRKAGSASKTVPVPIRQTGTRPVPKKVEVVMPPKTLRQIEEEPDEDEDGDDDDEDGNAGADEDDGPDEEEAPPPQ